MLNQRLIGYVDSNLLRASFAGRKCHKERRVVIVCAGRRFLGQCHTRWTKRNRKRHININCVVQADVEFNFASTFQC